MRSVGKLKGSSRFFVGLMSGTSADGIDAVVAQLSEKPGRLQANVVAHVHRPFAPKLQQHILRVGLHGTVGEICELNFALGNRFADAAIAIIRKSKLQVKDISAIGSHGQTIHHLPNARTPSTLQIGEAAIIAERTGILTVADFRVGDVAAGGQGAPLVPYADWILFSDKTRPRIIQNIGGIGNLTFVPARGELEQIIAFDTGPGNMVIDAVVIELSRGKQKIDRGGRWAARGNISEKLLAKMLLHPFLRRPPPKTTGREEFGEAFIRHVLASARRLRLRHEDIVASVTAFTAITIASAYRRFVFPKLTSDQISQLQIILGGGGAKNVTLRWMLQESIGWGHFDA